MIIWIDAQLSPELARWINKEFSIECFALRDLGLRNSTDRQIFLEARKRSAIIMTKDSDFIKLTDDLGIPPQIIWITCGNTSNERMKQILIKALPKAIELINAGEKVVEIGDTW